MVLQVNLYQMFLYIWSGFILVIDVDMYCTKTILIFDRMDNYMYEIHMLKFSKRCFNFSQHFTHRWRTAG